MYISLNLNYRMLICNITIYNTSKYKYDVTRAMQALAHVHVALSRGLACHVTSTWARAENAAFLHLI